MFDVIWKDFIPFRNTAEDFFWPSAARKVPKKNKCRVSVRGSRNCLISPAAIVEERVGIGQKQFLGNPNKKFSGWKPGRKNDF